MALTIHKIVSGLPSQLTPDALYAVRTGAGFYLYVADKTGSVAHKVNAPAAVVLVADETAAATASAANPGVLYVW